MKIDFSRGKWDLTDITYAYTWRFEETPVFVQKDDCVENLKNDASPQKYDNVSILTREKFPFGTRISTRCAFEGDAAPLITVAKQMDTDSRGVKRYGAALGIGAHKAACTKQYAAKITGDDNAAVHYAALFENLHHGEACRAARLAVVAVAHDAGVFADDVGIAIVRGVAVTITDQLQKG